MKVQIQSIFIGIFISTIFYIFFANWYLDEIKVQTGSAMVNLLNNLPQNNCKTNSWVVQVKKEDLKQTDNNLKQTDNNNVIREVNNDISKNTKDIYVIQDSIQEMQKKVYKIEINKALEFLKKSGYSNRDLSFIEIIPWSEWNEIRFRSADEYGYLDVVVSIANNTIIKN